MKKSRVLYLALGFIAGITYLIACGGSSKVEEAIGQATTSVVTAISVTYDNATSALSSTTVQAAIDEVVTRIKNMEVKSSGELLSNTLAGTWKSTCYPSQSLKPTDTYTSCASNVTFNSNGTFDVVGPWQVYGGKDCNSGITASNSGLADRAISYELKSNSILILKLMKYAGDSFNTYVPCRVEMLDTTKMIIQSGDDPLAMCVMEKQ